MSLLNASLLSLSLCPVPAASSTPPTEPLAVSATRVQEAEEAPSLDERKAAIEQGVAFLLDRQEAYRPDRPVGSLPDDELAGWQERERARLGKIFAKDGGSEWPYEGVYRVRLDGRIPAGYRVGGTSIVCEALLRTAASGKDRAAVEEAVLRSLDFVLDMLENDESMSLGPKSGYDVRGWGHLHALQLVLMLRGEEFVPEKTRDGLDDVARDLIARLEGNTTRQGGWNYAGDRSVSPFMTGSTLLVLFDAVEAGFAVDEATLTKALDALQECRTDEVSYAYSGRARRPVKMPGSSARSSVAELALYKAGRSDVDQLRLAVDGFFVGWDDLLVRKSQQGTHVGEYGIAPYYFFFGHTFAAYAIENLPEKERAARRDELATLLWRTREEDGRWNDRIFPRTASYSTAMSMLALHAKDRAKLAEWEPSGDEASSGK